MSGKRVLTMGWFGAANVGDELLLAMQRQWLEEMGHELVALSIDPPATRRMHGIEAIDRSDLGAVAAAMEASDLFCLGGGGLLNTHFAFSRAGLFDFESADTAAYCRPALMARQLGVPVLAWAQGLGPLVGAAPRATVAEILGHCRGLSVRDDASLALARELGVSGPIALGPDPVWALSAPTPPGRSGAKERIAVVVRRWEGGEWEDRLLDALRAAIRPESQTLVWIPFQQGEVPGRSSSDLSFVASLAGRVGSGIESEVVDWRQLGEALASLADCDRVIAMRLHAQILAISMGKPCLAIEYDPKMSAASEQSGLPDALRLPVVAPPGDWHSAVSALLRQTGSPVPSAVRERLAREALVHRDVLQRVLAEMERGTRSMVALGGFDWLGAWDAVRRERELAEARRLLEIERSGAGELRQELALLRRALYDRDIRIQGIERRLQEKDSELQALGEHARREAAEHSRRQAAAESRIGSLRAAADALQRKLALSDQARDAAQEALRREAAAAEDAALASQRRLNDARRRLAQIEAQLNEVLVSRSWRLTAPLRALVRRIQRVVGRQPGGIVAAPAVTPTHGLANTPEGWCWVDELGFAQGVVVITSAFEFDELVNQRPINAAKWYADNGWLVVFVVWQWSADEVLANPTGYVARNVLQVPLYEFMARAHQAPCAAAGSLALFLVTLPAPILVEPARVLRARGYCLHYDIMDEWEEFASSGQAPWYRPEAEAQFVIEADSVSCVAPSLEAKFSGLRGDIAVIGNGYQPELLGVEARGIALAGRGSGVVGYFGHLTDAWFDWRMVLSLARANLQVRFEIIGYGEPEWVRREADGLDNLQLLGKVHPSRLREHVRGWQLGLIPFCPGKLAEAVDPINVYEYLYFGLPVFCTGIAHLATYPGVRFAGPGDEARVFGECLGAELPDSEAVGRFLHERTWSARFGAITAQSAGDSTLGALYRA